MTATGLAAIGAYAPRLRISAAEFEAAWGSFDAAGIDEKAVPDADEDAVTMGVEAARRALDAANATGTDVAHLAFATTTPPMAEEDLAARLCSILHVPDNAKTQTMTGSTRAGAQALDATLDGGPFGDSIGLVIVSDCPRGDPDSDIEHAAGAGSVALVVSEGGHGTVVDRASHTEAYPGTRFRTGGDDRTTGLGVTQYDRDAFTTVLGGAADGLDVSTDGIDAAAVQSPDGKLPYRATGALGIDAGTVAATETVSTLGDTGAASAFLGAATAFADDAERVLVATYGSGASATLFVVDGPVPVKAALAGNVSLSYADYLRRRGEITSDEPEGGGAYVSVPSWQRTIPQRHRLVAGRCSACEALNFPPAGACTNCHDRTIDFEHVELPGTGTVEAVTTIAQGGAPPEFVAQQSRSGQFDSAVVALDGPAGEQTVSVPAQVLHSTDDISIGTPVVLTTRRIYTQEGVIRYGFKAQVAKQRR
ncbi:MAG: zinc ribbon domain-containing protein [Haloarcula sp.]